MKIPPGFLHENLQLIMEKNEKCVIVFTSTVCYLDRMAYNTSFTCDSKHTFERKKQTFLLKVTAYILTIYPGNNMYANLINMTGIVHFTCDSKHYFQKSILTVSCSIHHD